MTIKQKEVVKFLENLVNTRQSIKTLNNLLSDFFKEEIKVSNVSKENEITGADDDLTDYNLMFDSKKEETYGYFDIYMLPMRRKDFDGADMHITEIGYEFE